MFTYIIFILFVLATVGLIVYMLRRDGES